MKKHRRETVTAANDNRHRFDVRTLMRTMIAIAFTAATATACAFPPSQYSAPPISGRIIDEDTKAPLPGVTVVAQWLLQGGIEGHTFAAMHVEEGVSDETGAYRIPGWGPIARPSEGYLDNADPDIFLFKSGYLPRTVSNSEAYPPGRRGDLEVRGSFWNQRTITLKRFEGSTAEYARRVNNTIAAQNLFLFDRKRCWWKHTPKAVRAFDEEMQRQQVAGAKFASDLRLSALMSNGACAPFDDFMRRYEETK